MLANLSYSSQINADVFEIFFDKRVIISVWKSSFRYVAMILDNMLYSEIFIFKTTIFPDSKTVSKVLNVNLDFGEQNVDITS